MAKKRKLPDGWFYLDVKKIISEEDLFPTYYDSEDEIYQELVDEYIETYEEFYDRYFNGEFFYDDEDDEDDFVELIS